MHLLKLHFKSFEEKCTLLEYVPLSAVCYLVYPLHISQGNKCVYLHLSARVNVQIKM